MIILFHFHLLISTHIYLLFYGEQVSKPSLLMKELTPDQTTENALSSTIVWYTILKKVS